MRNQRFCPPLLDKSGSYEGIWPNKRKSFVKSVGMNGSYFKNETFFVSLTAIITIWNGWNGTKWNTVEWLAALKCRAAGLSTSLFLMKRRCSANLTDRRMPFLTDVKFATFNARNSVNDVGLRGSKIVPITKLDLGPEMDLAERTRVTTSTRARKGTRLCR